MDGARAFLLFSGHAHPRQRSAVALNKTIQTQAERLGVEPVGFYPLVLLVELLRTDHVTVDPHCVQLPLQRKTKPTRFVNGVHLCSLTLELGCPKQDGLLTKTLRLFRFVSPFLRHHHVKSLMHYNPKVDRTSAAIKLAAGSLV